MKARWFVRGDIDGFFGLALDNLVQLLLIDSLCRYVIGLPEDILYGRILPGAAVSLLVGNLFYSWQAMKIARETGRDDICALPYGINTVSLFAHVFLVMLPAKILAMQAGADEEAAARIAWQAGLVACVGSGLIEFAGAFVAEKIRKATPRAALLSTLAGIALTFISLGFIYRTFARPIVGLTTLGIVMLIYFGKVRFKGRIPGGLVAVAIGTGLAWMLGIAPGENQPGGISLHLPIPVFGDLLKGFGGHFTTYMSVIIPMGLFNVIGSLQNIESAEAAGDKFDTRSSLAVNGIGTLCAAVFGSCFPTTIYIGHPGWKGLGARIGYSVLNGAFITIICLTGTLAHIVWAVPIDAGMAIVIWIGIVITAQAFQATPREHAPAVVIGLLPAVGAWGATILIKNSLRVGMTASHKMYKDAGEFINDEVKQKSFLDAKEIFLDEFQKMDVWVHGAFALEQGFIFTAMLLSAATVSIIERKFFAAAVWAWIGAALSIAGLMHAYQWTPGDTAIHLTPAWEWAMAYAIMGACFLAAKWVTEPVEGAGH